MIPFFKLLPAANSNVYACSPTLDEQELAIIGSRPWPGLKSHKPPVYYLFMHYISLETFHMGGGVYKLK